MSEQKEGWDICEKEIKTFLFKFNLKKKVNERIIMVEEINIVVD